ncbi:hypothetical protein F2P81_015883 [Scophthalmus maximus]|uniref:Uncharacterized protein n=1 Tax=Scophthalmus maximus TaxID=52904 RepID=A0A6A4SGI5_SCOMX|nr:hypothetical protein F2P81_015883 [Scophthalmus maximus]
MASSIRNKCQCLQQAFSNPLAKNWALTRTRTEVDPTVTVGAGEKAAGEKAAGGVGEFGLKANRCVCAR